MKDNLTKEKCYACGRPMKPGPTSVLTVYLVDDDHRPVHVGPDCFRHVHRAASSGYRPPHGGPRLFATAQLAKTYVTNLADHIR